ncbi:MAG: oligosaccharide flippase family protein [Heliobacteriaceae bacterium]|jgi:O-antigen/teichoic acid export membrane protein|nr:oligosaccharide flippase family protein [Heliobacteriaceae bacterium]
MEYVENKEAENAQLKEIFGDMAKYAPSKIFGMLGNAIIIPIYTSILSPQQYGLYALSIALLSFLCIIFSDWVGLSGLRFFKKSQLMESIPKYLTTLVLILIVNLSVMFLLAFVFRESFYEFFKIPVKYFLAILLLIIPVAVRALLFQLLRAQLKAVSFTISTILNQILTILLSVIFVKFFNIGAMGLLLGMGVSIVLTDLLLIYQSSIMSWFKFQKIEWHFLLPIFKYGLPIAATALSAWIINQSNKFIMNSISGFSEVGIVGVAYGLTLPILMTVFSIITVAVIPRIINMYEEKIDVRPLISRFTGYYIMAALPAIVLISIYSQDYVRMLSPNENFYSAAAIIPYFAFGTFFMALTDYTTLQYHLANKTHIEFIIKLTSGVVGVVLNIMFIPKYGLTGVGIATLCANFLYFFLSSVIILPGLSLRYPTRTMCRMLISFVPFALLYYGFGGYNRLPALLEMIILMSVFYLCYWLLSRTILKRPQ